MGLFDTVFAGTPAPETGSAQAGGSGGGATGDDTTTPVVTDTAVADTLPPAPLEAPEVPVFDIGGVDMMTSVEEIATPKEIPEATPADMMSSGAPESLEIASVSIEDLTAGSTPTDTSTDMSTDTPVVAENVGLFGSDTMDTTTTPATDTSDNIVSLETKLGEFVEELRTLEANDDLAIEEKNAKIADLHAEREKMQAEFDAKVAELEANESGLKDAVSTLESDKQKIESTISSLNSQQGV